ncbi:hypothetical protein IE53DRAFT_370685 [Violaceomyces palustris]|uniref:Uncharacterized protein n=1 Tax=Violaceomyces palustris TaxID=1673888 RepID=A0ACD0NRE4_9BASI|nr:hypothetical protein IE53DRAFT_370685 [Violaceomyces palustris]
MKISIASVSLALALASTSTFAGVLVPRSADVKVSGLRRLKVRSTYDPEPSWGGEGRGSRSSGQRKGDRGQRYDYGGNGDGSRSSGERGHDRTPYDDGQGGSESGSSGEQGGGGGDDGDNDDVCATNDHHCVYVEGLYNYISNYDYDIDAKVFVYKDGDSEESHGQIFGTNGYSIKYRLDNQASWARVESGFGLNGEQVDVAGSVSCFFSDREDRVLYASSDSDSQDDQDLHDGDQDDGSRSDGSGWGGSPPGMKKRKEGSRASRDVDPSDGTPLTPPHPKGGKSKRDRSDDGVTYVYDKISSKGVGVDLHCTFVGDGSEDNDNDNNNDNYDDNNNNNDDDNDWNDNDYQPDTDSRSDGQQNDDGNGASSYDTSK